MALHALHPSAAAGARWPRLARALAIGIGIAALVARADCARAHDGHAALPTKGATVQGDELLLSEPARAAIGLETAKVTLGDLSRVVRARARVELPWYQQAMITTLVPGRIERVLVRPGEAVEAGQELARVESLELEDFQHDLLRADAELDLAGRLLALREELGRSQAVTQVEVLEARHKRDEAAAQVTIATQKLLALGLDGATIDRVRATREPLGVLPITSPIGGVISHADVRTGQVVATDEHLYHVVDLSEVSIVAEVLESDVAAVRAGQPIRAEFPALPGVRVEGTIDHVHPALDPQTRTREAVAHVANPGGVLRPGLSGQVEIEVERVEQAIVCPTRALIAAPDGPVVLLRRGEGKFERRKVTVGLRDGERVEVRDGLFPGDQVIVVGTQLLAAMFHTDTDSGAPPVSSPGRVHRTAGPPAPDAGTASGVVARGIVELPTQAKSQIAPRVEGRLVAIHVEPGQRVEAGQVLAEIDSLPLRNLQLDLLRIRLEHQWARDALERLRMLALRDAASRIEVWHRESELAVLEADLGAVRSKLRAVGLPENADDLVSPSVRSLATARLQLRAPAAGRVAYFGVVPGQIVRPSDTLFEVLDQSHIWVRAYVFERDAVSVRIGQEARISFPALPGRVMTGTVVRTAPLLEQAERVLPVWVEVENPDGLLAEGMLARAVIAAGGADARVAGLSAHAPARQDEPRAR